MASFLFLPNLINQNYMNGSLDPRCQVSPLLPYHSRPCHQKMTDFDDLLNLEARFYEEGHNLGLQDGEKAGRIEGRIFGLEKGFEKYVEMGKLHGRCLVWNARSPALRTKVEDTTHSTNTTTAPSTAGMAVKQSKNDLNNPRLEKHLRVLYALTEPESLSTENTEDAVSDFDDRYKRAMGKIKIIERLVGEESVFGDDDVVPGSAASRGQNIEDVDILKARH